MYLLATMELVTPKQASINLCLSVAGGRMEPWHPKILFDDDDPESHCPCDELD